jgi:hypothetical protein
MLVPIGFVAAQAMVQVGRNQLEAQAVVSAAQPMEREGQSD